MNFRLRLTPAIIATALAATWQAHGQFALVDDFQSYESGEVATVAPAWTVTAGTEVPLIEADEVGRKHQLTAGSYIPLGSNAIAEASTGTLFFRIQAVPGNNPDLSAGLSDLAAPGGDWNDFEAYSVIFGGGATPELRARNNGDNEMIGNVDTGTWYNIWLVVSNGAGADDATDIYDVYLTTGGADATPADLVAEDFGFRNNTTDPLQTFKVFGREDAAAPRAVRVDDIYVDNSGENLSNPSDVDSDGDGMDDVWEEHYFGDTSRDGDGDLDNDGLLDADEFLEGTDPTEGDTDGDGLDDGAEVDGSANTYSGLPTDPLDPDTDGDGATDGEEASGELNTFDGSATDPLDADTDFDGDDDTVEFAFGSDPLDNNSVPERHVLIGPDRRNGSFELVEGAPGYTEDITGGWDVPGEDVDNWKQWSEGTVFDQGGSVFQFPSEGERSGMFDNGVGAYNMTTHIVEEGEIIQVTWTHTQDTDGHTLFLVHGEFGDKVVDASNPGGVPGTFLAAPDEGVDYGFVYQVPAGSPLIGETLGVAIVGTSGSGSKADDVVLRINSVDADGDGLDDYWEDLHFGDADDNPTQAEIDMQGAGDDPDNDGADNEIEYTSGSDPTDPDDTPEDLDADGLPDDWEIAYFGDLSQGADDDADYDFATNLEEFLVDDQPDGESDPTDASSWPDTDGDGLNDGWENAYFGDLDTGDVDSDGDGFPNSEEMAAGSDPTDTGWTPERARLAHRWSFNGDLADSAGGSDAEILDGDDNATTGGTATLSAETVSLAGGDNATSDYVALGSDLLNGSMAPVTLEFWATQNEVSNWSRIFDSNNGTTNEWLFMSWTTGTDLNGDSVNWTQIDGQDGPGVQGSVAPYAPGTEYHIVLTLTPTVFGGDPFNSTTVEWFVAPADDASLGYARGSFTTTNHLADLDDVNNWLGRSPWDGDDNASASYNEVRIWDGALTLAERELLHGMGPDSIDFSDSDGDGLYDVWETANGFDPSDDGSGDPVNGASGDPDNDGFDNLAEQAAASDPNDGDSTPGDLDADGMQDEWEVANLGGTDALPGDDPDGDFDTNLVEFQNDTDPNDMNDFFSSTGDSVPDSWKAFYGIEEASGGDDSDGDELSNELEFAEGKDPTDPDTDGDGLSDFEEDAPPHNTDGLDPDTDDDGLLDGEEVNTTGTDPLAADTDGDGFGDKFEIDNGSDPNDPDDLPAQPGGFTLVEDFEGEGMTPGSTFNGVNGWTADAGLATVVADPVDGGNQTGQWLGGVMTRPLSVDGIQVVEGNTGTMFFQVYIDAATVDHSFGLSDVPDPGAFGDFEAQFATITSNLHVRNGGAAPDTGFDYPVQQWLNVWIAADNAEDAVRVWVESPSGETGPVEITAEGGPYAFRSGTTDDLVSLLFVENAGEVQVLLDNLHVDPTGQNLANPLGSAGDSDGDGMDDSWEVTYFGDTSQPASGDFDGDGTDNLAEFRLGLIPDDPGSRFAASGGEVAGGFEITWPSAAGTTFTIERSTTLESGEWSELEGAYPGESGTTSYTDASAPPDGAFYRVTLND